jgi:acetylornithine deacetylase/succinyl-diaminopimelate desuccinylase-like protein
MRQLIEVDPPHGATVRLDQGARGPGWASPAFDNWLADTLDHSSRQHWGAPPASCGVGGTIPFMGMLGDPMPDAQFLLIGVLGPESNAHGPDEFLHIPTVQRVTATVRDVLAAHAEQFG